MMIIGGVELSRRAQPWLAIRAKSSITAMNGPTWFIAIMKANVHADSRTTQIVRKRLRDSACRRMVPLNVGARGDRGSRPSIE
jgi:hypothetical protein